MSTKALSNRVRALRRKIPAPEGFMSLEEWELIQTVIFEALQPHMQARVALADALMELDARQTRIS